MYKNLTDSQKEQLNKEQCDIIKSKEKYIVVSASPGCGKTYTLIRLIKRNFQDIKKKSGFIACSFTREASRQLENKLRGELDLSLSFVGTIDALILQVFVNPFKNRCLYYLFGKDKYIDKLDIIMPKLKSKSNEIAKVGKSHSEANKYYQKWKENFFNGKYEICYCSYLLAIEMLENLPEFYKYFGNRFKAIYIDEAQDLNEFQHDFLNCIKEKTNLRIFLIGDKNQSIYEFRGARPELFSDLVYKGYYNYSITVSVRCDKSIMDFSNTFINPFFLMTKNEVNNVEVYDQGKVTKDMIEKVFDGSQNIFILCETNDFALSMFDISKKNNWGFSYTKSLDLTDESFNGTYLNLLEELLRFYYNYHNPIPEYMYSIEIIKDYVSDYVLEKKLSYLTRKLKEVDKPVVRYIKELFESMKISINETVYKEIESKLSNNVYKEHYLLRKNEKRIMTIHSSKGLEAEKILLFVCYEDYFYNKYPSEREGRYRNYFVAFSRAEKELYIFYQTKVIKKGKTFNVNQSNIISKIDVAYQKLLKSTM